MRPIETHKGMRKIMCSLALIMTMTARPVTNLVTFQAFFTYSPFLQCFSGVQARQVKGVSPFIPSQYADAYVNCHFICFAWLLVKGRNIDLDVIQCARVYLLNLTGICNLNLFTLITSGGSQNKLEGTKVSYTRLTRKSPAEIRVC